MAVSSPPGPRVLVLATVPHGSPRHAHGVGAVDLVLEGLPGQEASCILHHRQGGAAAPIHGRAGHVRDEDRVGEPAQGRVRGRGLLVEDVEHRQDSPRGEIRGKGRLVDQSAARRVDEERAVADEPESPGIDVLSVIIQKARSSIPVSARIRRQFDEEESVSVAKSDLPPPKGQRMPFRWSSRKMGDGKLLIALKSSMV